MAGHQITARVTPDLKQRFSHYAASCGMADSELAKLLLHREHLIKQLATAVSTGHFRRPVFMTEPGKKLPTITAHYSTPPQVQEFDAYVQSCFPGLKRGIAAAWIIQKELSEKWLQRALLGSSK